MKIRLNVPLGAPKESDFHPLPLDAAFAEIAAKARKPEIKTPMIYSFEKHGVTQSVLNKWRECPTKARMGLQGYYRPSNSIALTFGNMFHHLCEKFYTHVKDNPNDHKNSMSVQAIEVMLRADFDHEYKAMNPDERDTFENSILFSCAVFPEYLNHWRDDFVASNKKTWVALEKQFSVPMHGGNFIGKRDGEYRDAKGKLWLFETKTKSKWDELSLGMIIARDLQVNSYMLAMEAEYGETPVGVLYNVVRRPQLRQKKDENKDH